MAKRTFIQEAINRPGRLTKLVGGPPSKNIGKVRKIADTATDPSDRRAANFYLNTLRPITQRRKGGKKTG